MDSQRSYRRLVKCINGQFFPLWADDFRITPGRTYALGIEVEGDHLRIGFDRREIINLRDSSHVAGGIGLYAGGNDNCRFSELSLWVQEGSEPLSAGGADGGGRRQRRGSLALEHRRGCAAAVEQFSWDFAS